MNDPSAAAYGGPGWSPRTDSLSDEIGRLWARFSVSSECTELGAVLVHRPGKELSETKEANDAQMLSLPDERLVRQQHDGIASSYKDAGVEVIYVSPPELSTPNQMFVADLMFMTPSGAIVGRPASTVRAGEERWVARKLADVGIPILRTVGGMGTFEGADAMWLDNSTVLIGLGLRTNPDGAEQVATTLVEQGVTSIIVDLPHGSMHLMGSLRIVDRDLAFVRSGGLPWTGMNALTEYGYEIKLFPDEDEISQGMAHNCVTLAPRKVLMPAGNPNTELALRDSGIEVQTTDENEITKAAGAIGCLSGILGRKGDN